jgi:hypothetical protein
MKKELFATTAEEATLYIDNGATQIDECVDENGKSYRLLAQSVTSPVKLRHYEDGEYITEITVPAELQCVPCGLKYKTEKSDACPICGESHRDIMLRNKVFEDGFRGFERAYTALLNQSLRIAQPIMLYISGNYTQEEASEAYDKEKKGYDALKENMKVFDFIFKDGILKEVEELKVSGKSNLEISRTLTGGDTTKEALESFRK